MNSSKAIGFLYIALTVVFTVYGQLIIKWRLARLGTLPADWIGKVNYFATALRDPFILSSFAAAFIASLTWMAAVTKFELSFAYPFMSAAFVLVLFFGVIFFQETLTVGKVVGLLLIVLGIIIVSREG